MPATLVATHIRSGVVAVEGSEGSNSRRVQCPRGVNKQVVCVSVVDIDYLTVALPTQNGLLGASCKQIPRIPKLKIPL